MFSTIATTHAVVGTEMKHTLHCDRCGLDVEIEACTLEWILATAIESGWFIDSVLGFEAAPNKDRCPQCARGTAMAPFDEEVDDAVEYLEEHRQCPNEL